MALQGVHHVAYRCRDTKETVEFYQKALGMDFMLAISEDRVPSTKEPDPYMHVFLDAGNGNVLAFFEIPNSPEMGRDPNTPAWVQHLAFQVDSLESLMQAKTHLESMGLEVIGPTNHELFQSIYFNDPNGHRIELAANTSTPEMLKKLKEIAPQMLEDWTASKRTVHHAAWLHEKEFAAA
ncbi:VOC family protein [Undibacterium cyanobacteriorum]|uniref:VOC family protein n=1 Tax=Undibacterium cyanobacteriorum TaxID=3073561 RepID=A0ABY9RIH3_9BURK|nr:VOC family protein [Undibacterium sp. 20NA77.5]WMW80746.1 VOC family protein [Undibacterium sp. 20NA77.5]